MSSALVNEVFGTEETEGAAGGLFRALELQAGKVGPIAAAMGDVGAEGKSRMFSGLF